MLPDRCSVVESGKQCANPPEFVVSVVVEDGEYMVGVACDRHRLAVSGKTRALQEAGKVPEGRIGFSRLKAVGTDCINADPDDFVRIGAGKD